MYGPTDNFSEDSSHVIPAIIKKIFQAKKLQNEKNLNQHIIQYDVRKVKYY